MLTPVMKAPKPPKWIKPQLTRLVDEATRARRLAGTNNPDDGQVILAYAKELEQQAARLEARGLEGMLQAPLSMNSSKRSSKPRRRARPSGRPSGSSIFCYRGDSLKKCDKPTCKLSCARLRS
jgi:hypothetical protein